MIDEELYLKVHHVARLIRAKPRTIIERGVRMFIHSLHGEWPAEWLNLPVVSATDGY